MERVRVSASTPWPAVGLYFREEKGEVELLRIPASTTGAQEVLSLEEASITWTAVGLVRGKGKGEVEQPRGSAFTTWPAGGADLGGALAGGGT